MACLVTAIAGGQTATPQPASNAPTTTTQNAVPQKANHSGNGDGASTNDRTKEKKKVKHDAKPALSPEEQEFEKVLQGIFG